jgi:hypothetical protein
MKLLDALELREPRVHGLDGLGVERADVGAIEKRASRLASDGRPTPASPRARRNPAR